MLIQRRAFCALPTLALATAIPAWAQQWPLKQPIRIIVPYPAGGNADSAARALADVVSASLKQVMIVENRPGASSIIGTDAISRAAPDGYTIGVVSDSHAINQAMARLPKAADMLGARVPYDAIRDFVPISGMILVPLVLVTNPKLPARTLKEVVSLTHRNHNAGLNFGTMGSGSPWSIHMHQLNKLTGAHFIDVPYKGLAPAATDLLAGQTDLMLMPVHYAKQYLSNGKLQAVATMSAERHALLPQVPTLAESGYPGLAISNYLYFVAPANTPAQVVQLLAAQFSTALQQPAIKSKFEISGDPYPASAAELSTRLRQDIRTYGEVIAQTMQ